MDQPLKSKKVKATLRIGNTLWVHANGTTYALPVGDTVTQAAATSAAASQKDLSLIAPMPASILLLKCQKGDRVASGDLLCVLEAMKMEYRLTAPQNAKVAQIFFKPGDKVSLGAEIIRLETGSR